jgi:cysteine desulfurase/selenocysteine lyase
MAPLDIKEDFGIYESIPDLVYLDSASTVLVPKSVTGAVTSFLNTTVASARRGAHRLAVQGSTIVEQARSSLAQFLDAEQSQISFQKSIPSAVASLALGYEWKKKGKSRIVIAENEEHNVLVALLRVAQLLGLDTQLIPINNEGELILDSLDKIIDDRTGIVAAPSVTVGVGIRNPLDEIGSQVHERGGILLSDITQSVAFDKRLPRSDADFIIFSANIGLMAPPGLAIQWIQKDLGSEITPGILGGSSVTNVQGTHFDTSLQPDKFESGVLNVPGIAGISPAIAYMTELHSKGLKKHMNTLSNHLLQRLKEVPDLVIYGFPTDESTIFAFNIGSGGDLSCHDVALFLDESNIAVRSGLLCAHPLVKNMSLEGVTQASLHAYNTLEDIDSFIDVLKVIATELV